MSARHRFPRARLHADRIDDGKWQCSIASFSRRVYPARDDDRERATNHPHVHRVERQRFAPLVSVKPHGRHVAPKGPHRSGAGWQDVKRRSGIAVRAWQPGAARRGQRVLKGNKPHERRPIDMKSHRATRPTGKRLGAATIGPMVKGRARSARASPIDSEGAGGRGNMTPRRTRESRGDAAGNRRANG